MAHYHPKEIVLIRHGKPLSAHNDKVTASQYAKWIKAYNKSELDPQSKPETTTHIGNSYIMVSPLVRAQLTATHYGVKKADEVCDDLREMDIPYYRLPVQLRTWHWVVVSRALWFLGKKGRFESFEAAKSRVDNLVARIEDLSLEHERLVLFGHGMTNYFTRKALMAKGWQLKQKNSDFWGITVLSQ
ncbi:hypothetical protein KUC3_02320 [Alteromonas sp. KC3]|uniref:histidine phosphatase family protein n=1 Tax=unclassified Alteromonas TaxID=2614992 RepID=UPI001924B2A7|nr:MULTISPECIES: phosphoglycerate mutase family protein [unclassified Alteromonas]BCO17375.1 hypothetical protein KUC3_02320 [Alteromonas sp. KC3]BCO21365.1 hypothetical protein KUC14_02340 [Alteromonas sp. KC14]